MKLNTALVALSLFGTASAFGPQHMAAGTQRASLTELEMANGAKHKAALKVTKKKVVSVAGSIALATASLPAAATAASTVGGVALATASLSAIGAGSFAAGIATSKLVKKLGVGSKK